MSTYVEEAPAPRRRGILAKCLSVLAVLAVVAGIGVVWYYVAGPGLWRHHAQYWLRMEGDREMALLAAGNDREARSAYIQMQVQLLTSPLVIEPALGRTEVARIPEIAGAFNPVELVTHQIEVKWQDDSELVIVDCAWTNPQDAAKICNAVVESYLSLQSQDEAHHVQREIELLEAESERRKELRKPLQAALDELRKGLGDGPISAAERALAAEALRESYKRFQAQLDPLVVEIDELTRQVSPLAGAEKLAELQRRRNALEAQQLAALDRLRGLESPTAEQLEYDLAESRLQRITKSLLKIDEEIFRLRGQLRRPSRITPLRAAPIPESAFD